MVFMKQMKSLALNLTIALGMALIVAGCSTPSNVNSGPIKAQTFSFVKGGVPAQADFTDNREQSHAMIQQAITDNLASKGLTRVDTGGDVTVAYMVILGNNVTTERIDTYFGYGRNSAALHSKAHKVYTRSKNPNPFEAGTLVVDLLDADTFKLLRRTHVSRPVLRDSSPENREANIREAVDAVLEGLRVRH